MYKQISITAALATMLVLGSCKKQFLELSNPNAVAVESGLQTENDITSAVNGAYQALRSGNCIGEGAGLWTNDRSDDFNSLDDQSNSGEPFQFTAFALVPSNSYLYTHWAALYTPISRANLVLSVIDNVPFASEDTRKQYIAEMKFVRALMYYYLVREFGDVPLVTERLLSDDQIQAKTIREPRKKVYDQIVADLKDVVASNLPVVQPAAWKGKVSLQAANALLGQVYLTMAANLDEGNKTANLNQAKTYLLACFNQKTFSKLSDIPFADVFDVNKKATNPEIIFQIVYKQGDPSYASSLARNNQAKGETVNSMFPSQGSGATLTKDLLAEFETDDVRTAYTFKYSATPGVNANFITKFRDNSTTAGTLGLGGNDWIIIRYADVILNIAEMYQMLGDNANAILYLDMVRSRAGRPAYQTMLTDAAYVAKYPTLKLAILHERRIELAFEHHRWHDLTRFFNPTELVAYFKAKKQADYDNSPLSNISTKDHLFPIPLREYSLNPEKMYQNPGY